MVSIRDLVQGSRAGVRTIERLFLKETGMTLGRWLTHAKALHALERLAAGDSVTMAGVAVGYDDTSAFIAMFKRVLGTTPGRYFAHESRSKVSEPQASAVSGAPFWPRVRSRHALSHAVIAFPEDSGTSSNLAGTNSWPLHRGAVCSNRDENHGVRAIGGAAHVHPVSSAAGSLPTTPLGRS